MTPAEPYVPSVISFVVAANLFVMYSRLNESLYPLRLTAVFSGILLLYCLLTGGIFRALRLFHGRCMVALTALMILGIPFSVWPGGSTQELLIWLRVLIIVLVTLALVTNLQIWAKAMVAITLGIVWTAANAVIYGSETMGRLSKAAGRFGDANDFAQVLLIGLMLIPLIVSQIRSRPIKIGFTLLVPFFLLAFGRTGSRGGLLGLIAIALMIFLHSSIAGKVRLTAVVALLLLLAGVILPQAAYVRYLTIFTDVEDVGELEAAEGSKEARIHLLKQSVRLTLENPVFGVGLGMFAVAENDAARLMGALRGTWHQTHNMYTQVSSELGIPAGIIFSAAIVYALRETGKLKKLARHPGAPRELLAAPWLNFALWGLAVSGFFLSVAYTAELLVIFALAGSYIRHMRPYLAGATQSHGRTPARKGQMAA